jgi:hypothetical protein
VTAPSPQHRTSACAPNSEDRTWRGKYCRQRGAHSGRHRRLSAASPKISTCPCDRDPKKAGISRKQAAKLIDDRVGDVEEHVAQKLMPALRTPIAKHLGEAWSLEVNENDR